MQEPSGWQQVFCSPRLDWVIERVALNARVLGGALGARDKMVAAASCSEILLWALQADGSGGEIGEAGGAGAGDPWVLLTPNLRPPAPPPSPARAPHF